MFIAPASSRRSSLLDPRRVLLVLGSLALLVLAPMAARAQGAGADSVMLQWTAPGDDGAIGTATIYHLRRSTVPITTGNWDASAPVAGMPAPLISGTRQSVIARGLSRDTTYYFAIRAQDDNNNLAAVSNIVRWDWIYDTAPPAAPTGLSATRSGGSVQVTWNANSESDLQGYSVYRATVSGGPFTKITGTILANPSYLDSSVPGGATDVWYRVTASDVNSNESAQSAAFHLTLATTPATAAGELAPAYPNPSRAGQPVCLPLTLSGSATGVVVDIVNAGGLRVRRLDVSAPDYGCPSGTVGWDGRNDAGAEVAPGVYRAWLIDGDRRMSIKLVRQP